MALAPVRAGGTVLGVDGCRGGWVAARVTGDDRAARLVGWRRGRLADVLDGDGLPDEVVAVDIPIGLPVHGRRACDLAGRRALGRHASRLFLAPPRRAFDLPDHAAANELLRRCGEPGVSAQTYALRAAVLEVEAHLAAVSDARVVEVHPELSFLAACGRVLAPKRSAAGVGERIAGLSHWVDVAAALAQVPPGVPVDDALDALAAAWTATRVRSGRSTTYPPDGDPAGPLIHA